MPDFDSACIFCRIVTGQIPSLNVFENKSVLAFLDINPLANGHLLVIPKQHYRTLDEASPSVIADLASVLPTLAKLVKATAGVDAYNVLQNNGHSAGQMVDHLHFHIIPRRPEDGLGFRWPAGRYAPGQAEQLHEHMLRILQESQSISF